MSETSLRLTEAYLRAAQQFDYFVTGGAGATLAYAVQSFAPSPSGKWDYLALVAWGFLFLAVIAGLWHLSTVVSFLKTVPWQYSAGENAATLREAEHDPRVGPVILGDFPIPPQGFAYAREGFKAMQAEFAVDQLKKDRRIIWAARARNGFLLAGLLILGVWKSSSLWTR